jgi:hypothetical protein
MQQELQCGGCGLRSSRDVRVFRGKRYLAGACDDCACALPFIADDSGREIKVSAVAVESMHVGTRTLLHRRRARFNQ